jgi:hypothetical protein
VVTAWNLLSLERLHEGALPYNPIDPDFYPSGEVYGHYDIGRRTTDILFGRDLRRRPEHDDALGLPGSADLEDAPSP